VASDVLMDFELRQRLRDVSTEQKTYTPEPNPSI
jgi:hypothetical protein